MFHDTLVLSLLGLFQSVSPIVNPTRNLPWILKQSVSSLPWFGCEPPSLSDTFPCPLLLYKPFVVRPTTQKETLLPGELLNVHLNILWTPNEILRGLFGFTHLTPPLLYLFCSYCP